MQFPLTGQLLVASSVVSDPMYAGGVCLIVHQDETDSIGVMLNRPIQPSPEMIAAMTGAAGDSTEPSTTADDDATPQGDFNRLSGQPNQPASGESKLPPILTAGTSENQTLHFGGPLSGPVVAIHPISELGDAETGQGIYVAAQKEHLVDLIKSQTGPCRLIVGHLGWKTEDLFNEIEQGYWHLVPATSESVFSSPTEMWPKLIRRATSNSLARWIGVPDLVGAANLN